MLEEKVNELHSKKQDGGKELEESQKENETLQTRLKEALKEKEDLEKEMRLFKE